MPSTRQMVAALDSSWRLTDKVRHFREFTGIEKFWRIV